MQYKNKNHSHNASVPQNPKSGTTENVKVNPSIAFGSLVTLRRTWDILWSGFPEDQNELKAWQISICAAVIQKLLNKGVKFPPLEVSSLSIDESNLIWYSYKYAELVGLVGGAE